MTNDFLVIGGGIAGISAAARLSTLGSVTLLEAESALGYHASGRSAAMFEENYGHAITIELNRASREFHQSANGGVLSPRGFLEVGQPQDKEIFHADVKAMGLAEISPDEAVELIPILDRNKVAFAAYDKHAWDLDTDLLMQNFMRNLRANRGVIVTNARATSIIRQNKIWTVSTASGEFSGRVLVNAAGAWADEVAGLAGVAPIGLKPCRRSVARLPAPGGLDVRHWPMVLGAGETWYAKPDAGKWLVSPAEEDLTEPHDAWADDMVLAEGLARYEEMVTEPVTRLDSSWAGLRTFSPDRSLVLGFDGATPDFFWLAGQGGYGFQTCPAASQLVAELIGGVATTLGPTLTQALSPARFRA